MPHTLEPDPVANEESADPFLKRRDCPNDVNVCFCGVVVVVAVVVVDV
jgi:hypothetical protein